MRIRHYTLKPLIALLTWRDSIAHNGGAGDRLEDAGDIDG